MNSVLEAVFGSRSAMLVLLFLENYEEGHASRMATTYDVAVMGMQRQLKRFEEEGVLSSRMVGRTRVFSFNQRNPTVNNLRQFLASELALISKEYTSKYYRQRQRPRRAGKPI